jgi:hypothetical protein
MRIVGASVKGELEHPGFENVEVLTKRAIRRMRLEIMSDQSAHSRQGIVVSIRFPWIRWYSRRCAPGGS